MEDLGPFPSRPGYNEATALDQSDPLGSFRELFVNTDPELIYLDGNSLGRMPIAAKEVIRLVVEEQWSDRLIRSWNEGWWELQLRLGDKLAPLVGAKNGEVVISDSTSINLYKLAYAAVRSSKEGRRKIVTDDLNFPTDVYILDGIARELDLELVIVESDGINGPIDPLSKAIDRTTALVSLSHTVFKSGYTYDMAALTSMCHAAGALVLWDLSHSVGAMPIDLNGSGADLAVGCTYKYLNGGPGSPAFLYVRREHQQRLADPISGWWGHEDPFGFGLEWTPTEGIRKFHAGTMPILSLAAIEPGLDHALEATPQAIRHKSEALSNYLIDLSRTALEPRGFSLASPTDQALRGSHVSFAHENAWPITKAMIEVGKMIPDFRNPDNVRIGLSPLYTTFLEVHTAVCRMADLIDSEAYQEFEGASATVT